MSRFLWFTVYIQIRGRHRLYYQQKNNRSVGVRIRRRYSRSDSHHNVLHYRRVAQLMTGWSVLSLVVVDG